MVLAEAADVLGGNILTRSEGGFTWEDGPNTFQPGDVMLDFLAEIGLQSKLVSSDPKLPRYVYYNGEMFSLPSGGGPPKDLVRLLSPLGLLRAAAGALLPTAASAKDETIAAFFERTLGPEVGPAPCPLPWTLEPLPRTACPPPGCAPPAVAAAARKAERRRGAGGAGCRCWRSWWTPSSRPSTRAIPRASPSAPSSRPSTPPLPTPAPAGSRAPSSAGASPPARRRSPRAQAARACPRAPAARSRVGSLRSRLRSVRPPPRRSADTSAAPAHAGVASVRVTLRLRPFAGSGCAAGRPDGVAGSLHRAASGGWGGRALRHLISDPRGKTHPALQGRCGPPPPLPLHQLITHTGIDLEAYGTRPSTRSCAASADMCR